MPIVNDKGNHSHLLFMFLYKKICLKIMKFPQIHSFLNSINAIHWFLHTNGHKKHLGDLIEFRFHCDSWINRSGMESSSEFLPSTHVNFRPHIKNLSQSF